MAATLNLNLCGIYYILYMTKEYFNRIMNIADNAHDRLNYLMCFGENSG